MTTFCSKQICLENHMNKLHKHSLIFAFGVGQLFFLASCSETKYEDRFISSSGSAPLNKVDQVLELAKGFATGTSEIKDLQSAISTLNDTELSQLEKKQDRDTDIVLLMVTGIASPGSAGVTRVFLDRKKTPVKRERARARCVAWIEALRPTNRPKGEVASERNRLSALILTHCPEQINYIKKIDGTLDALWFNEIADVLTATEASILDKLTDKKIGDWFSWAISHVSDAQKTFSALMSKATIKTKDRLRNRLLSEYVQSNTLGTMIDQASLWGLDLNSDRFVLPSLIPGTSFHGSLLYVLTKRAISSAAANDSALSQALTDLHGYSEKIKAAIGAGYSNHVLNLDFGVASDEKIHDVLTNAFSPTHRENFVNYYLAMDSPKDVYDAAGQPESDLTNKMLKELYDLVIDNDAKAILLAQEPTGGGAEKFIHRVVRREATHESADILNRFLTSLGSVPAERVQLNNNDGGSLPITLAVANTGAPAQKSAIINRLLQADDGSAVAMLTDPELTARADRTFADRGVGGSGQKNFKLLYSKLAAHADKRRVLRSRLLNKASANPNDLQELIDQIVDTNDRWGLKANLATDEYNLNGVAHAGSLLYVLTQKAIATNTKVGFLQLRNYAKTLKASLGSTYNTYVTTANPHHGAPNTIEAILGAHLLLTHRQDFRDYYLGKDTVGDLYNASGRPEDQLTNATLRELFDDIIDNDSTRMVALSTAGGPGNEHFLHRLLKRSADAAGDAKYMLGKFLDGLGGSANETAALDDNNGGKTPLKVFFDAARTLPVGYADAPNQKASMVERLLRNIGPFSIAAIDSADLARQIGILFTMPTSFKKLYGVFPAGEERLFLRSALLEDVYNKNQAAKKKLIFEITEATDVWGLRATVETDDYELPSNPAGTIFKGPLLYVLTRRAIDDKTAGDANAYIALGDYALMIKNSFSNQGFDYNNHINTKLFGVPPKTMVGMFTDPAMGNLTPGFAHSYLASGTVKNLFDAVNDLATVDNALLKELYVMIVGTDDMKAHALSQLIDDTKNNETFLHKLLKRSANKDTSFLLDKFLDSIVRHNADNVNAELALLNNGLGTGAYPIKILVDVTIPARAGDEQIPKAIMLTRLLKNDDGTASKTMTPAELLAEKFYSGEIEGQEAFKALYAKFNGSANEQRALRSSLLANAYDDNNKGFGGIAALVEQMTDDRDVWGLKGSLATDDFEMEQNPATPNKHSGSLLFVLAKRAIDDATAAANDSARDRIFSNLRKSAMKIKNTLESAQPDSYFVYASKNTSDAITALKTHLDATQGGFAEYYLVYTPSSISSAQAAALLFNASKVRKDTKVLDWLYKNYMSDEVALEITKIIPGADGNNFVHNLAQKDISKVSHDVLTNFLTPRLDGQVAARTATVSADNTAGKNPINIFLAKPALQPGIGQNMLAAMVRYADNQALEQIISTASVHSLSENTEKVLTSIKQDLEAVDNIFNRLDDAKRLGALAYWCGKEVDNYLNASTPILTFKGAFLRRYNALAADPVKQVAMRNQLFKGTASVADKKMNLKNASIIVNEGFLDPADLNAANFDPFGTGNETTLLYALLKKIEPDQKDQLNQLVTRFKDKFAMPIQWQEYLNYKNGAVNESVVDLMTPWAGSLANARDWLSY